MEIREGRGGRFGLGDLGGRAGRGITVIQEIWVGGGGSKNLAIRRGGGWIFSGITQCHIPR